MKTSAIYEGSVYHRRLVPRPHAFRQKLFFMYLDRISVQQFADVATWEIPFLRPDRNRLLMPEADRVVSEALIDEVRAELGIEKREVQDEEIIERCIYPMINEGCKILEEGVALRASDIDIVWINGYGFPAYRGGPMCYGELTGLGKVYERIAAFEQEQGSHWKPSALLKRLAASGGSFRDV